MLSGPESILRSRPETEAGGDTSDTQYPTISKDVKISSTNVGQDILRTYSTETGSTAYSSGIHSVDFLMDIYPSISESGSEYDGEVKTSIPDYGDAQEEDNDDNTVTHENLSFFSLASKKEIVSRWLEDRPFDEESLRALSEKMSERGEHKKNIVSKSFGRAQEYILPPANYQSVDKKLADNKPATKTRNKSPMTSTLTCEFEEQNDSVKRSFQEKKASKEKGESKKCFLILSLVAILLLAIALLVGFFTSRAYHQNRSENQATAGSGEGGNEGSDSSGPSANMTDDRPWGTLVTYFDPIPENLFPLGQCEGDCDEDADCAEGLICFQREPNDPVPFCFDGENDKTRNSYCTYPSFTEELPASESDECVTTVSATQACFLSTDNVVVVDFQNCEPKDGDWIGLYPDGTTSDNASATELAGEDYLNWAYTCGSNDCTDSPLTNKLGFPTEHNNGLDFQSLRVLLLRDSVEGPPYEIIAKSEAFVPADICSQSETSEP